MENTSNQTDSVVIYKTTNYSIFNYLESNRQVSQKQLNTLTKSIQKKNLLNVRPIIVNNDLAVIDGQHRLTVAKQLNIPIYYVIADASHADMINLNTNQRNWQQIDYIDYYAKQGIPDYQRLKEIINEKEFTLTEITLVLDKKATKGQIKHGGYMILHEFEIQRRLNLLREVKRIYNANLYLVQCAALKIACDNPDFDEKHFIRNLSKIVDRFRAAASIKEQTRIVEDIYNYRLQSHNHIRLYA